MSELCLTSWQRRRLRQQLRQTRDARVYRRTLALLQVDRGLPLSQVAEELSVSRQSIYNWARGYARDHDPAALADGGRTGRPGYRDSGLRDQLRWLMCQRPPQFGYLAAEWTAPLLLEELGRGAGLRPSDDTLRRELDRLGYVWKRGRYALDPDPELEKKNGRSAGRSAACRGAASCWPRTRPTCCCCRPCGPAGPSAGGRLTCRSRGAMRGAWSSGP